MNLFADDTRHVPIQSHLGHARLTGGPDGAGDVLEDRLEIHALTKEAEARLSTLRGGRDGSFDAYVSKDPKQVRRQVRVLYETLYARGLTYRIEPPGPLPPRQEVRLPEVVLWTNCEHG